MRKTIRTIALAFAIVCSSIGVMSLPSCTVSQSTIAYKSLATVGSSTDAAVKSYMDLVVKGQVKTNSVPRVMAAYGQFQTVYGAAVVTAQQTTNYTATAKVIAAAADVASAISEGKATK